MRARTYLAWMRRETRGSRGRMLYFAACLAVGVAAVVGTAALTESVEAGYRAQSRAILGADVVADARRPLPPELYQEMARLPGQTVTRVLETAGMVFAPRPGGLPASRLVLVSAVSGRYPLYGDLVTEPPGDLAHLLAPDTVVVAAPLLDSLDLSVGDGLYVGGRKFRIAASIVKEPAHLGFSSMIGPRIYLSKEGLERSGLLLVGTRVEYRALLALPGNPSRRRLDAIVSRLQATVPGATWLDFDTHYEVGPGGRRSSHRMEGFLGLVALLSLVIGGIGVAQIVRAWLASRTPAMAVMRCLGVRPREILVLSLGHTALLALAGSVVGAGLGTLAPFVVRTFLPGLFPVEAVNVLPLAAICRGLLLGVGLAVAFALPPLTGIWRVAPARVLRAEADPLPPNRLASGLANAVLLAGVLVAAWIQGGALAPALWFTGGFLALTGILFAGARLLMFVAGRTPRARLHPYLKHGISALARPGAGTTGAVVALGLGTMVVTAMWLVQTRLREGILAQIPPDAPTMFFVDIPPEHLAGVEKEVLAAGAKRLDRVPVVTARITKIDGRSVTDLAKESADSERSRHALTREQRLTWEKELPADNEITAGSLWSDPDRPEVSVEERFAGRLGVHLGSTIEFDVDGRPVTLTVTSLRSVEWQSFSINFFLVVEPGALPEKPSYYVANARVPADAEQGLQDRLARDDPNVTVVRVRPILDQILKLLTRIAAGIRLLGSFTVLAGLAILAGAVSASALRRGSEVALLKTLGVTRAGIAALFLFEYGLCGAVAGALGTGGALLLAMGYLRYVAELPVSLPVLALPIGAAGCGLLTAVCGLAASARALRVRPIEALR